jgi:hypothetical protein
VVNIGATIPAEGRAQGLAEVTQAAVQHLVAGAREQWLKR